MAPWIRIAAAATALVLLLSLVQLLVAIHPPRTRSEVTPDRFGLAYEEVSFTTEDGLTLAGWFIPAANATDETILVGHGYPYDKGNVLPGSLFLHERYNLLLFDHRSFGGSEGRITTVGLREARDVHAAVAYLEAREDVGPIGALGFSLSGATILMAQDPAIQAVVADSSYVSLEAMLHEAYPMFPGPFKLPFVWTTELYARTFLGAWPSAASPEQAIARTTAPVLLIHGAEDGTIPAEHSQRLHEAAPAGMSELWMVDGATHGAAHQVAGERYEERVLTFFDQHLSDPRG